MSKTQWVSVKNDTPEDARDVLAFAPDQPSDVPRRIWIAWYMTDRWWSDEGSLEVTHWMPLPEPPEVESREWSKTDMES